jgi:acetyl esterase/lipase
MVEPKLIEKDSKIHPDLAKLLAKKNELNQTAFERFKSIKHREGIFVTEPLDNLDFKLMIELSRFQSEYVSSHAYEPIPDDVKLQKVDANEVPAEWIINPGAAESPIIMHLFSGGYVIGNLETRRRIPYLMGSSAKIRCLNIGYRLAPEHPFPAALEDSVAAYKWILSTGLVAKDIIITGASAGGALAVSTILKLKELGIPLPSACILLSPWTDLAITGESIKTNAEFEPNINPSILNVLVNAYLQDTDPKNPFASPLYANLEDLPPLLIQAGGIEVLLDDSLRLAERAKTAGVDVTLETYDGMVHVFQNFGSSLSESQKALENIANFIHKIKN